MERYRPGLVGSLSDWLRPSPSMTGRLLEATGGWQTPTEIIVGASQLGSHPKGVEGY